MQLAPSVDFEPIKPTKPTKSIEAIDSDQSPDTGDANGRANLLLAGQRP